MYKAGCCHVPYGVRSSALCLYSNSFDRYKCLLMLGQNVQYLPFLVIVLAFFQLVFIFQYRLDTEEGCRYAEHHDTKISSFQKCMIVLVFCKSGHK